MWMRFANIYVIEVCKYLSDWGLQIYMGLRFANIYQIEVCKYLWGWGLQISMGFRFANIHRIEVCKYLWDWGVQTDEWWVEVEVEARGWCQLWRGRPLQQVLASDFETLFRDKIFTRPRRRPLQQVLASDSKNFFRDKIFTRGPRIRFWHFFLYQFFSYQGFWPIFGDLSILRPFPALLQGHHFSFGFFFRSCRLIFFGEHLFFICTNHVSKL